MAFFLSLALQVATLQPSHDDAEIVVLARKLRQIQVDMKLGKQAGKMALRRCRLTRGSGEPELDAIPCDVAQQCIAEEAATRKQLETCVENRSNMRIDAILVARRAS